MTLRPLPTPSGEPCSVGGEEPWASRSDEALAAAAARGCTEAFDELFRRFRGPVRELVVARTGTGRGRAEELTQDVFFEIYRSLASFAGRSDFRTWAYAVARNVCRYHQRRWRRRRRTRAESPIALTEIPDLAPDAAERLAAGERRREVRREVARLPDIYRSVLVLRDWEDLSYAEIAQVLEIPVGTVRSRLHQARARLAAALLEAPEEESDGV